MELRAGISAVEDGPSRPLFQVRPVYSVVSGLIFDFQGQIDNRDHVGRGTGDHVSDVAMDASRVAAVLHYVVGQVVA